MSSVNIASQAQAVHQAIQQCMPIIDQARKHQSAIRIQGKATKLGQQVPSEYALLDMSSVCGVIDYQPSELFIRLLAGTSLEECKQMLAENGQRLAFDAVDIPASTIGGAVAANACGSKAYKQGKARDALLGVSLIDGDGSLLHFGGSLMKNVAGFDVVRMQCGAYGKLGVLASLTLRVCPVSSATIYTICEQSSQAQALTQLHKLYALTTVQAAGWRHNQLVVSLEGSNSSVERQLVQLQQSATWQETDASVYQAFDHASLLQEHDSQHLVLRMHCPIDTAIDCIDDAVPFCLDWFGALRWYKLSTSHYLALLSAGVFAHLAVKGIVCTRMLRPHFLLTNVAPFGKNIGDLHKRVLRAFDPRAMFNPDLLWYGV